MIQAITAFVRGLKSVGPSLSSVNGWLVRGFGSTSSGAVVTPDVAMNVATVYACVRIIAESAAMLPLGLYQELAERKKRKDSNHPVYTLIRDQPNSWQTAFEWREGLFVDALTRGNGYSRIVMDRNGVVQALLPMRARDVSVLQDDDDRLWYHWSSPRGHIVLPQGEVFHLRGLGDGPVGKSPLAAYRESVGGAIAAEQFSNAMFRNGAQIGGFVKVPEKMTPDGKTNLLRWLEQRHQGFQNAMRVGLLDAGSEWVTTQFPPKDLMLLELRKYLRTEIASIFRVPPHMIGDLDRSTNNNIEQQAREFIDFSLAPWLVRFEQAALRDLLSRRERGTRYFRHNVNALLRGDMKARADFYSKGRQWGWLSTNDVREYEDLDEVDGGDRYLEPVNMHVPGEKEGTPA
jgi:HK97 family phage portal protein